MNKPKIIAFYLPQFHPVKENNEWFGEGFTEWTNVAKAKPLFKGHDQPRVPRDLGFYDLRLADVRAKQADMAKEAGVDAFCYYHYWFGNGRVILEKPLQEVVRLGEPDFPFCICWANHSWYKKSWNPDIKNLEQALLLEQVYPGDEDIINHFYFLLPAFKDNRYLKVNGRLLFAIYNLTGMDNFARMKEIWNDLAIKNGLPGFYFLSYTSELREIEKPKFRMTDGTILSLVTNMQFFQYFSKINKLKDFIREKVSLLTGRPQLVFEYKEAMKYLLDEECRKDYVIPVIVPNWDYTPRRGAGGIIFKNARPDLFKQHVKQAIKMVENKPEEKKIIFLKSWNEWGEGNYMEPDLTYGKGYICALREALNELGYNKL